MFKISLLHHIFVPILGLLFVSLQPPLAHSAGDIVSSPAVASTALVLNPQKDLVKLDDSLFPIDHIESNFKKLHKSLHSRRLKQAYDKLTAKNYTQALRLAASVMNDATYLDYGLWISAQASRDLAFDEISKHKYVSALKFAKKAISHALQLQGECPYSPFLRTLPTLMAQSEVAIAEVFWTTKKWTQAQVQYERAFQRMQGANTLILLAPEILGHYAQGCKKNQTPFCVSWLRKLTAAFSKQRSSTQAIFNAFPLVFEKQHSFRNQGRFATTYKSLDLDAIAFEAAMKLYVDDKYKESSKAFEQLLADFPRSSYRARVRYWMAQAVARSQGAEKAKKLFADLQLEFPLTYYGLLASRETGVPIESAITPTLPVADDKESSLLPQELFHLKRAENFIAENANELAAFELRELKPRDSISSPFLVYLAMLTHKGHCYSLLFSILSELLQRGSEGVLSAYGLHLIFPLDYFDIISKNTDGSPLDPILVMSLIKQESSFEKAVNSPVGAMGLMQLMPHTALDTDPKVILSELLEADENIRVGSMYLNKLLARYKGNIVYALGAYNAGPNAMDRWIKATPPKREMTEFIESITYRETREYVASIIRNYFWYSRRIKGTGSLNFNYFWNTSSN